MKRRLCIHGHFYQPPREDPWTGEVPEEKSAAPFHDWNHRITHECYRANLVAPLLDAQGHTSLLFNNYTRISFDFGPTLLSWLEHHAPHVYEGILRADRESRDRFSGHGNAIAQAYHHLILPLANSRDKLTEILWGIRDFEYRFGRAPEGMWLPETAVDLETLVILANQGIRFTILAPHQAKDKTIDPQIPYRFQLPQEKSLAIFFYDGPLSQGVAFEGLLKDGETWVQRILSAFSLVPLPIRLVSLATDGESYGHHHHFGDMALAYLLNAFETRFHETLTNYGEFLELYPPERPTEITENTSWSCAHGVERWRSHCGCRIGSSPKSNQSWRKPLRAAMDWLRDGFVPLFEQEASAYFRDPWEARNGYIDILLYRSSEVEEQFFSRHGFPGLNEAKRRKALKLLEMQSHLLTMFTSCGWFFDDPSGPETGIVLKHAARALQMGEEIFQVGRKKEFLELLEECRAFF